MVVQMSNWNLEFGQSLEHCLTQDICLEGLTLQNIPDKAFAKVLQRKLFNLAEHLRVCPGNRPTFYCVADNWCVKRIL